MEYRSPIRIASDALGRRGHVSYFGPDYGGNVDQLAAFIEAHPDRWDTASPLEILQFVADNSGEELGLEKSAALSRVGERMGVETDEEAEQGWARLFDAGLLHYGVGGWRIVPVSDATFCAVTAGA